MKTISETLSERGSAYGSYAGNAEIVRSIMEVIREAPGWENTTAVQAESIEMIVRKISRLVNGNPAHVDSWHDIAGYATLAEQASM